MNGSGDVHETPAQMAVDVDDIRAAAARIEGFAVRTPALRNRVLDDRAGGRVFLKAECLQRTGSFKFRGAYNAVVQIAEAGKHEAVVAYSSGNHAQGVAAAAELCGLEAHILMPRDAPEIKKVNTQNYGARIVGYDRNAQDRVALAQDLAQQIKAAIIPPFDDEEVIAGQGTVGLELIEDMGRFDLEPDFIAVPCSGGGLGAGIAVACAASHGSARVILCEPQGFDDYRRSLEAGRIVSHNGSGSICDALLVERPGKITFAINKRLSTSAVSVAEDAVRAAVRFAARELKLVLEPSGSIALAAILSGKIELNGRVAGIVLSGGNIDRAVLTDLLTGHENSASRSC